MLASRMSTWLRDNFWRRTMAPILSRPMRWNVFLPMSMPIVGQALRLVVLSGMGRSWCWQPRATFAAGLGRSTAVHPINGRLEKRTSPPPT